MPIDDVAQSTALAVGLDASTPSRLADYYELTKPRMNMLVVVTTVIGYFIASRVMNHPLTDWMLIHVLFGTALTAASASAINQVMERNFDRLMRRTRNRPVASGRIRPLDGYLFAAVLGVLGVGWLAVEVNLLTSALGLTTLLLYVLIYTPLKRKSPWCTLIGAVPGAIPPVMGVTAITNQLDLLGLALFAILFIWQMPHFFALALMYQDDYAGAGYKMLPSCRNGRERTHVQIIIFTNTLIFVSLWPLIMTHARWLYGFSAIILGALFLWAAVTCVIEGNRNAQRRLFLTSIVYLPLLLGALMIDQ